MEARREPGLHHGFRRENVGTAYECLSGRMEPAGQAERTFPGLRLEIGVETLNPGGFTPLRKRSMQIGLCEGADIQALRLPAADPAD